jgi:hypothetical protein
MERFIPEKQNDGNEVQSQVKISDRKMMLTSVWLGKVTGFQNFHQRGLDNCSIYPQNLRASTFRQKLSGKK